MPFVAKTRRVQQVADGEGMVVFTAGAGLFLSTLDTGIANVALPSLSKIFHVDVAVTAWIITFYILALCATIVVFGRFSDRFGQLPVYSGGLALFGAASILCGSASSVMGLILFRGIQGVGAAMIQATAAAMITTRVPIHRQGAALGTLGMLIGLGPVCGPTACGFLLSFSSWRWIFWVNVPICLAALWGCRRLADVARKVPLNLHPLPTRGNFALLLDLFRQKSLLVSLLAVAALGAATATAFLIPPYFLDEFHRLAPWQVGLINLASPMGLVLVSRQSGKGIRRFGTTRLMTLGFCTMGGALAGLSFFSPTWNPVGMGCLLLLYGMGAGLFVPPNMVALLDAGGHALQGTMSALQRLVQNIGIAAGTAVTSAILREHPSGSLSGTLLGFRDAWLFSTLVILCITGLFFLLHPFRRHPPNSGEFVQ